MSSNGGNSFLAFLLGTLTGGVLALLFAPEKGSNTRDKLSFLLDRYKNRLEDIVDDIVEGKDKVENEAKSEGEKIINNAKVKAEELLDDVNDLLGKIKDK
jgi:gas vesicle protein